MQIQPAITRSTATREQLQAEAKAKLEQLKKFEKFDLDGKYEEIKKTEEKLQKLEGEVDAYFDFLGIPKDAPTPATTSAKRGAKKAAAEGHSISLQELKEVLAGEPAKTTDIRKKGWSIAGIKTLVAANPALLELIPAGPWPKVKLLK